MPALALKKTVRKKTVARGGETHHADCLIHDLQLQSCLPIPKNRKSRSECVKVNWEGILPIQGKVVVIEDDPTLQAILTAFLEDLGADFVAFDNADDALTHLLDTRGECILVIADHGVPGQVQGTEFVEMVKGRWPHIAAILTSGYLIAPSAVPAETIYLLKPWSLDELVVAVAALLQPGSPINKR